MHFLRAIAFVVSFVAFLDPAARAQAPSPVVVEFINAHAGDFEKTADGLLPQFDAKEGASRLQTQLERYLATHPEFELAGCDLVDGPVLETKFDGKASQQLDGHFLEGQPDTVLPYSIRVKGSLEVSSGSSEKRHGETKTFEGFKENMREQNRTIQERKLEFKELRFADGVLADWPGVTIDDVKMFLTQDLCIDPAVIQIVHAKDLGSPGSYFDAKAQAAKDPMMHLQLQFKTAVVQCAKLGPLEITLYWKGPYAIRNPKTEADTESKTDEKKQTGSGVLEVQLPFAEVEKEYPILFKHPLTASAMAAIREVSTDDLVKKLISKIGARTNGCRVVLELQMRKWEGELEVPNSDLVSTHLLFKSTFWVRGMGPKATPIHLEYGVDDPGFRNLRGDRGFAPASEYQGKLQRALDEVTEKKIHCVSEK
jgi:hypothetical protein